MIEYNKELCLVCFWKNFVEVFFEENTDGQFIICKWKELYPINLMSN